MQKIYEFLLDDFTLISWGTFLPGLVESIIGGFLTAVVFVPIYKYFISRMALPTSQCLSEINKQ